MKINKITNLSGLIIVSIIFVACKKDFIPNVSCSEKSNSIKIAMKLLPGSYSWAYTKVTNQSGSYLETPTSTGLNYKYIFQKNGTVNYYEGDTLKSSDNYEIDYEFKVTTYPSDSSTIVIISDKQNGQRKDFFRPYLCNDSALFYNPYNSVDFKRYFKRN
ncbi:MAG: hypothetical protein JST17_02560 [Bacteroidetes bacterium]|nr:hypothetical protein [Bacteroidota bacterium]